MKIKLTATHDNALQLVKLFEAKDIKYKLDLPDVNMVGFELDVNEVDFKTVENPPKQNPTVPTSKKSKSRFEDTTGNYKSNPAKFKIFTNETATHTLDEVLEQAANLADTLTKVLKVDPDLKDVAEDITIELQKLGFLK